MNKYEPGVDIAMTPFPTAGLRGKAKYIALASELAASASQTPPSNIRLPIPDALV
jgi:hypothetical protein